MTTSEKCPKCEANLKVLEACEKYVPGVTRFFRPCPSCSAPPVSSVPGEAGPYPSASKTCEHIQHGINAGVCLQCQLIPDYRELVNHGYFMCRASMKAEMEAKDKDAAETMSFTVDLCNKAHDRAIGELKSELEEARADKVKAEEKGGELCRVLGTIMLEVPEAAAFVKKYNQEKYIAALTPSKETKP